MCSSIHSRTSASRCLPRHEPTSSRICMAEFRLPKNSRINPQGHVHKAPSGSAELRTFRIYRFDPTSGENPRIDTFELDVKACGPMVLDALIQIKASLDSSLTFRR